MWLTKDNNYPEPVAVGDGVERGSYVFFNWRSWQRARMEFELSYESLDNHIPPPTAAAAAAGSAGNGANGGGGGGQQGEQGGQQVMPDRNWWN